MTRYCLTLEYDGTDFCGWQAQENGSSVQQALEEACFAYCGEKVVIYGAGRTDSGVHAFGQAAHFDLMQEKPTEEIQAALNFHLRARNRAVGVLSVEAVSPDFHARFSALKRHYLYIILNRPTPAILMKGRAWHVPQPLAGEKMAEVAEVFIGKHNFTTFRAAACQAKSPIKTLDQLSVERDRERVIIRASARSFLHHQVRSLVGALVAAGKGKLDSTHAKDILAAADRSLCPPLAPACGLYLVKIDYPQNK